jgi:hypothetical protein
MKFRLSNHRNWAHEFTADNPVNLDRELRAAMVAADVAGQTGVGLQQDGSPVWDCGGRSAGWMNTRNLTNGVFYLPGYAGPARMERRHGNDFLRISHTDTAAERVWREAFSQSVADLPAIERSDCDPRRSETVEKLSDLYNDLVSMARNQRRQYVFRSPAIPLQRACTEESQRNDSLTMLAREYVALAIVHQPDTDWAKWQTHVGLHLHREVAEIVIDAVMAAVAA